MAHPGRTLIVGGGIAGLSLAAALRRRGLPAELVERSPSWPAVGAGIALHANAVRALRELGLREQIDAATARLPRWAFLEAHGESLCVTDLEDLWGDVGPCLGITRVRLQEILLGAADLPRRLGVAVTAIDGAAVSFSDGSRAEYDLVVGADGINSTVRRLAVNPAEPEYAGTMAWRGLTASRPAGLSDLTILMGEGGFFGLVPMGAGGTYGFAGIESTRFEEPVAGRLARFRERFAGFGGPVPEFLAELKRDEDLHCGPLERLELDRWHAGPVVLIGDAAHATTPQMGQGGALAVEDALVLAELLAAGASLADFEARRRPRAAWVAEQSRIANRAWLLPPAVRDGVLRERGDGMLRERYAPLVAAP